MNEKLLTLQTVMSMFDVSRATIGRWTKQGYLEQRKVACSSRVYITESSVNNLIKGEQAI